MTEETLLLVQIATSIANNSIGVEVLKVYDDRILLKDVSKGMTITNGAEYVVKWAHENYPGRRVWYVDTEGNIDELTHEDGTFTGFAPGGWEP